MSSLCCCRGLLSLFGVREYPLDVVAKTKLDRAKMNRTKQNDYSTMTNDVADGKNGSVVNTEPQLSDVSRASSRRTKDRRVKRKPSSRKTRRARKHNNARTYDDSDSDSSVDSTEENLEVMRKSMRNSRSLGGSRDTLASAGSRGSRLSEHVREVELEDEVYLSPKVQSPARFQSPRQLSPQSQASSSPRRSPLEEDLPETIEERIDEEEFVGSREEEGRRNTMESPDYELQEEDAATAAYVYERPVTPERLSPTSPEFRASTSSSRQFQRRAVRKVSPQSSPRSLKRSTPPSSSKWEVEDAGSIYRRPQSSAMGSDDDELALAREASIGGERSTLGSDEEYEGGEASLHGMEPISACGTLDVAVQYSLSDKKLQVTIIEAHDLPSKARGGSSIVQVRAVLLPAKKKKYKTKVQHIGSPRFAETFKLTRATPEDLKGLALRLRMYGIGKLKDRLIGEAIIRFDELNLIRDPQLTIQLQLEPRTDINRVGSESSLSNIDSRSSSMMSLSHGGNPPEILIGLSYNAPTGRLCVEIIKGSHFRNLAMAKPPDTFVKLSLLNSACQEMSASKTSIRRGQPNPVFKEPFFFQVALFQLSEVTLMVSVYNKRTIKKKEMIGWVAMGRNSSSEPDEQHWIEMKEGKGQQVCRWHPLIDT